MATEGYFFKFASKVSSTYKVPTYSIVFQALIAIVLILIGSLDQIFTYMGFALSLFPILVAFSVFKLRMTNSSKLKLPGYPWIPAFFIAVGLILHALALIERPLESGIAIFTVLLGIPAFYLFRRGKHNTLDT